MSSAKPDLPELRQRIQAMYLADEATIVPELVEKAGLSRTARATIDTDAADLVRAIRSAGSPGLMEVFLSEYGLSTREGVALMCLAEALLRVPDTLTIDQLIEDKIAPSDWGRHLGHSSSSLVNASTWGLMLTGKVLDVHGDTLAGVLRGALKRLGEPVIRTAASQAMRELGRQFVLGTSIEEAIERARGMEAKGYSYSYDMLGEAACTEEDARHYHLAYSSAITALAKEAHSEELRENPGISVKLSALHPRFEATQRDRIRTELTPRVLALASLEKSANIGFNIDAEEADRLDPSLDVIESVLADPALAGWDGFGVVIQSYSARALPVLEWLHALAARHDRRIMVRLVKGAYWDAEIKRAQVLGLDGFPVFTRKSATDACYLACARGLLAMTDRIYPQFATHNAHSAAAILHMADDDTPFEFQRLHGMGEALHRVMREDKGRACRIYAPVGRHRDLLAYLVRRLLENGANSSFVNRVVDPEVAPAAVAPDPFGQLEDAAGQYANPSVTRPAAIFGKERINAKGWDFTDTATLSDIDRQRNKYHSHQWHAVPTTGGGTESPGSSFEVRNPASPGDIAGFVVPSGAADIEAAFSSAEAGISGWSSRSAENRAAVLHAAADLYEAHAEEFFALCSREAGKTLPDAIAEVREAVDFLRYYAAEADRLDPHSTPRGIIGCISPWNFPLAIFTGQVAAALAAGNAVIAKPAEQTPLIAARAAALLHEAGIPNNVLHLLPGDGPVVGAAISADARLAGMCFTGSTDTARLINRTMAKSAAPGATLIAETGGLNAMIVDSTALPEQVVRDVLASAFQSAGQRCSALRVLYLQSDIADHTLEMLFGAMDELKIGDPWDIATDIGPVIDRDAKAMIDKHVALARRDKRLLKILEIPDHGLYASPCVIRVDGIEDIEREVFGPVLHVATFDAADLDNVVDRINAKGYGLTFGLHTRVDSRVQQVVERVHAGNIYVNRNQIGAVVGSQPFGGEGLSGTGPKAGGPHYVANFTIEHAANGAPPQAREIGAEELQSALDSLTGGPLPAREPAPSLSLPGPTGESNRLSHHPRGTILCLGPTADMAITQAQVALSAGNRVLLAAPDLSLANLDLDIPDAAAALLDGRPTPPALQTTSGFQAVLWWASPEAIKPYRMALAERDGPIVPLISELPPPGALLLERHLCIDTTAAGGNASLLAAAGSV